MNYFKVYSILKQGSKHVGVRVVWNGTGYDVSMNIDDDTARLYRKEELVDMNGLLVTRRERTGNLVKDKSNDKDFINSVMRLIGLKVEEDYSNKRLFKEKYMLSDEVVNFLKERMVVDVTEDSYEGREATRLEPEEPYYYHSYVDVAFKFTDLENKFGKTTVAERNAVVAVLTDTNEIYDYLNSFIKAPEGDHESDLEEVAIVSGGVCYLRRGYEIEG